MPSIVQKGFRYIQTKNSIQCLHCKDILVSTSIHDFHMCRCDLVGIDGGISPGNRILGNPKDYMDLSIWKTEDGLTLSLEDYETQLAQKKSK